MGKKPRVIDAKYQVIGQPKQKWWQGWYVTLAPGAWIVALVSGLIAAASLLR